MYRKLSWILFLILLLTVTACSLDDGLTPIDVAEEGIIEVEPTQNGVIIVRNNQREALPVGERAQLSVGDQVIVTGEGQARLQLNTLLEAHLLQEGEVTLQSFTDDGAFISVTLHQAGGVLLTDFNADKTADHRLTIETDFATMSSTGARFLVAREAAKAEWVVNLGETLNTVEVTAAGDSQSVSSGTARWVAFNRPPSEVISVDQATLESWLETAQEGEPVSTLGDMLFPAADLVGEMNALSTLPDVAEPVAFGDASQGPVMMTLNPTGLFGSPTYSWDDCDDNGSRDVSILAGVVEFDFSGVLAQVRALDVSIVNRNLPGNGAVWLLDSAGNEVGRQLLEVGDGASQILTFRASQSFNGAKLAMVNGCLVGFSLTPSTPSGAPAPPRPIHAAAVSQDKVVVNVLADGEMTDEEGGAGEATIEATAGQTERQGTQLDALPAGGFIKIDGDITDWNGLNRPGGSGWTPIAATIFDEVCSTRFPGQEAAVDLAGQVRFAYDEQFLYVAFQVEDDGSVLYGGDALEYFLGDSPQLSLDSELLGDFANTQRSADDWQIDFYPDPTNPEAVLWELGSLSARSFAEASVAVTRDGANYILEAALPWQGFGLTPQAGDRFGLAANINDNDTPETDAQECIISTAAQRAWNDPTTWGTLFLLPPNE